MASQHVISIGAVCFGIVIGYVTYRTLVRQDTASVSDIAAVVAAVGGGVVAERFSNTAHSDSFGWYSIGLLIGFAAFLILRLIFEHTPGKKKSTVLGD